MTPEQRTAMQQALDALENAIAIRYGEQNTVYGPSLEMPALAALRAELAKPDQLPIAYIKTEDLAELSDCNGCWVWAESVSSHADNPGLTTVGLTPVYAQVTEPE